MIEEFLSVVPLRSGEILVVGCSSSEVLGEKIGTNSSPDTATELFNGIKKAADENGVFIAEVMAWMGADLILIPSYFIVLRQRERRFAHDTRTHS